MPDAATERQTVFLVDDDPSVRRAVGRLLRSAGLDVAAFDSARAFLDQRDRPWAGCVVLDVAMPGMTGPELQAALARCGPGLPVVFLTGDGDLPTGVAAMRAGAVDFLAKPCPDAVLLDAVRRAFDADRAARAARDEGQAIRRRFDELTPREHEVMLGVVAGRSNKQIGADLGMVEATVKIHRGRVMTKLCVDSVPDLVRLHERGKALGIST